MNPFPEPLVVVDVETTGMSARFERIIEIAIVRIEDGKIKQEYSSFINPEIPIPPEITSLTGITGKDLTNAPRFFDIKNDIRSMLSNSVFVAHNVHFDYAFIKSEFSRYGETFTAKRLDTVRLFRMLYPQAKGFSLDRMIDFFGFTVHARHRARDDARVLYDFLTVIRKTHGKESVESAVSYAMRKPALPPSLAERDIDALPEMPGVYLLYGDDKTPIYIGKSINIRNRVISHFSGTASSTKELKIFHAVKRIEFMETSGELSALLLESALIKKFQPIYNRQLRRTEKIIVARASETPGQYATIRLETVTRIEPETIATMLGVFRSMRQAKEKIREITKTHALCPKLTGIEKCDECCFWQSLGWCRGACIGKESIAAYNMRFALAFSAMRFKTWPFPGPVLVSEHSDSKEYSMIINQWCVLSTFTDEDKIPEYEKNLEFNLDTYRILVRHLIYPSRNIKIIKI